MAEPRRVALLSTALPPDKKPPNRDTDKQEAVEKEKEVSFSCVYISVEEPTEELCPFYDFAKLLEAKKTAEGIKESTADDPFGEAQEDAKLAKLAKHFDEKYGPSGPRDLRELGAGYDQNDPFVDDSESAEAVIPSGWTTQHGGFYISTGPLYIRQLKPGEADSNVFQSGTTEECLSACKSLSVLSLKRKVREESSSEYDSEEDASAAKTRRLKQPALSQNADPTRKAVSSSEGSNKKNSSRTVASILAEKAGAVERQPKVISSATSPEQPSDLRKTKEPAAPKSREPDMGMRKAALAKYERDFRSEPDNVMTPLPEDVGGPLNDIINQLKRAAATWEGGKCNFFTPEHNPAINRMLLELEYECRLLRCGLRSAVFSHLAGHLPCTKETLTKRARKLRHDDMEFRLGDLMKKVSRAVQEETAARDGNTTLSKTLKKLIIEAVYLKMGVYDLHKARFGTHEDYVKNFADTELLPLWKDRPVDKQTLYAQAFIGLAEALRPRSRSNRPKPANEEKETASASIEKGNAARRTTMPSSQDGKTIPTAFDHDQPVSQRIPKLHYTREGSLEEKKTVEYITKEAPSAHTGSFTSLIPDRIRSSDAPSPFTPLPRPRSGDGATAISERQRDTEKSQQGRSTPTLAQNLSRSSTPSASAAVTRPPSKGSVEVAPSSSQSFVQPSKTAKIYKEPRPSSKNRTVDSGKGSVRISSSTSGGTMKKYAEPVRQSAHSSKSGRSSSGSSSDARNLSHSTDAILAPRDESKKHGTIVKVSSRHKSSSAKNAASPPTYNPTASYPVGSIASPYSAFSSLPLMVGFAPENMLGWGAQYGAVFPESFQPMSLIPGAGSAFNGVASSFASRSGSTSKSGNPSRTPPYHSGDTAFGRPS